MNPNRTSRKRQPKNAQRRARQWVNSAEKSAFEVVPPTTQAPRLGAFTIRRSVLPESELFENDRVIDVLNTRGANFQPMVDIGVTLISPREGRHMTDPWSDLPHHARDLMEDAADDLPARLTGYLSAPLITGARKNQSGRRFIGFALEKSLTNALLGDRKKLIEFAGYQVNEYRRISPHISIAETLDHTVAVDLTDNLAERGSHGGMSVELGPPEVLHISSGRFFRKAS